MKKIIIVGVFLLSHVLARASCSYCVSISGGSCGYPILEFRLNGVLQAYQSGSTCLAGDPFCQYAGTGWTFDVVLQGGGPGGTDIHGPAVNSPSSGAPTSYQTVNCSAGTLTGTNGTPYTYRVNPCFTNNTQFAGNFELDGCNGTGGTLQGPVSIAPGGVYCFDVSSPAPFSGQVMRVLSGPQGTVSAPMSGCYAGVGGYNPAGSGGSTGAPGDTNSVPNPSGLSPLPTGTNALTGGGYSAGITQIVSAVYYSGQMLNGSLGTINGQLSTANSSLTTANGTLTGISNLDYRISTNSPGGGGGGGDGPVTTNLLARAVSELASVTNAVAIGETNRAPSMGDIPSSATNLSAAWTAGSNAVSSQLGTIDGYISGFGTEVSESTLTNGADSSPFMIGSIGGIALNLDPDNLVPGLSTTTKAVWTLLLLIGFGYWAGKLLYDTALAFSAAQTGGVPNIEGEAAGFGGNILGVITAALIPLIIIGLWLAVLDRMLALIGSSCFSPGTIGAIISGFSVTPSGASTGTTKLLAHFASAWFPLHLALCLLLTGLLLQWGALKVVLITAAAQRFLFGK